MKDTSAPADRPEAPGEPKARRRSALFGHLDRFLWMLVVLGLGAIVAFDMADDRVRLASALPDYGADAAMLDDIITGSLPTR